MKRSDRNMNVKAKIYVRGGDKSFTEE